MPFKIGPGSLIFHEASRSTHRVFIFGAVEEASAAWNMPSPPPLAEPRTSLKPDPDADCACASGRAGSLPAPLREQVVCRAKQNELKPRARPPCARAENKFPRTILRKVNVLSAP
jgi:hypothetical protein